ncbi:polysaccharide biosynthesis protein [Roseburia inulinivorans]|uniref:UDP-glucose 4-epimerase n=1 Tax=Roseburia inulinivorans TaxID=360807 RepID=A0A173XMH5_9FIRM|nr:nucleoside-diphosphate sugar epimerase/dehydratase [Roseburia inulinivorans]CUN52146.1 UDP-glucose 4-epimerase [Roseburia inulinivorans]
MYQKMKNIFQGTSKTLRIILLLIYDICAVCVAEFLALWTRFEFSIAQIEPQYAKTALRYTLINIVVTLVIFAFFKLYSSLWRYASVQEMLNVVLACLLAACVQSMGMHMLFLNMPRSYYILYLFFLLVLVAASRFFYRGARVVRQSLMTERSGSAVNTMIIGAGDTAFSLIKDMSSSWMVHNRVVCVIDADPKKIGTNILGSPIVGNDSKIPWAVEKYSVQEIFIAIPHLAGGKKKEILEICKNTGCKLKILPSMAQIVNDEVRVSNLREVEIEDLLGREQVKTNLDEVMGYIAGRVVLVTGGGGSIGSELCRQIASHHPKQLIILDIYENTTYDLQLELKKKFPQLNLEVLIGSVRNTHRVDTIFKDYKPEIVFHAAAHKHVPLMEDSPNEAIKNNVFGTLNVARAAGENKTARMVLISTDKAVNPTNIMGASKRICEMVVQGMNRKYADTNYVAVRFGNVLGSNGSVIPLFKKQIAAGGPVTVTDKNIIRYFMTIPEAVSLVLQAGSYAKGGEIFVLDMGEPVRIDDMARNLIKLSGYEPDVDIPIVYTGLRPGEKLFEECLREEEGLQKTPNNLIFIGKPIPFDENDFFEKLVDLKKTAYEDDPAMKKVVKALIPSYQYKGE